MSIKKQILLKSIFLLVLALALFLLQYFGDIVSYLSPEKINKWLSDAGYLAPFLYIIMMILAVVISPIPSLPLNIAAGGFFGPFYGTVYSVIGGTVGAVLSFMIARYFGRELIERFLGGHINFCSACSNKLLTKLVFFSRFLPVFSFDLISYGAGITKMSLKNFCLATFMGMIPLTFLYNYFGSIIVVGKGIAIILGLVMLILFFVIPRWIERNDLFALRKKFQHK